jgi:hypothetical protein
MWYLCLGNNSVRTQLCSSFLPFFVFALISIPYFHVTCNESQPPRAEVADLKCTPGLWQRGIKSSGFWVRRARVLCFFSQKFFCSFPFLLYFTPWAVGQFPPSEILGRSPVYDTGRNGAAWVEWGLESLTTFTFLSPSIQCPGLHTGQLCRALPWPYNFINCIKVLWLLWPPKPNLEWVEYEFKFW